MIQGKAFDIPKSLVWKSYHSVRRNRGAPGVDGQTLTQFDVDRDRNLYKIWNRMVSGSYFPPPVLAKSIAKSDGGERVLGIPTVADRIAQGAVKLYMEEILDPIFHVDSYGYRPGKSAHQALEKCSQNCFTRNWVLEVDIKSFFDTVRHDLVIQTLNHHKMPRWVVLYCQRWLEAPMAVSRDDQSCHARVVGTPQGGVISPLLANLFLHYAFDMWMVRERNTIPFERYADDIVCHCATMKEATQLHDKLVRRFAEVGLTLSESKTAVVYIDTFTRYNVKTCFTFLGFDFKVRTLRNFKGELFRKCMPGAAMKAMKKIARTIRDWRIHRSVASIEELSRRFNATIRGWINYYDKFWYRTFAHRLYTLLQSRLLKWAKARYRVGNRRAIRKLELIRGDNPRLFAHWYMLRASDA